MKDMSVSYKKPVGDTRNNGVTMMFVTKYRFNCFRKQSHIDTCTQAFKELEQFGFAFGDFGFAGTHVHFQVNIPKRYSVQNAEIMLKSRSAKRMFERHPGFRKRYPRGSFWSPGKFYRTVGDADAETTITYVKNHHVHQTTLTSFRQPSAS